MQRREMRCLGSATKMRVSRSIASSDSSRSDGRPKSAAHGMHTQSDQPGQCERRHRPLAAQSALQKRTACTAEWILKLTRIG